MRSRFPAREISLDGQINAKYIPVFNLNMEIT